VSGVVLLMITTAKIVIHKETDEVQAQIMQTSHEYNIEQCYMILERLESV
jgi:hypothetical protein